MIQRMIIYWIFCEKKGKKRKKSIDFSIESDAEKKKKFDKTVSDFEKEKKFD